MNLSHALLLVDGSSRCHLQRPDPISTRKMCIITLTRIFHLTYQYPTLVREITTPHLPGFITATLNLVSTLVKLPSGASRKPKANTPFMETVLRAMLELIPRHPTIFRPFGSQLRSLLSEILSSPPPAFFPESVIDGAEQLFASLHKCAPKDKSGSGWSEDCRSTILSVHRAADHVFRAIVEQWESVDPTLTPTKQHYDKELADGRTDALGLTSWDGIHAGSDRMITLMRILSAFISMPSSSAVAIPIGSILDLTSRLASVTVPSGGESPQSGLKFNTQIGRDERELLFAELPRIHVACMDLLAHVTAVLEKATTPITQSILEQVTWVFRNEKFSRDVRTATNDMISILVSLNGPTMTKQSVASVANVLRSCCHDLIPKSEDSQVQAKSQSDPKSKSKNGQAAANADSFLNPGLQKSGKSQIDTRFPALQQAASGLLQNFLTSAPSELLPASVRAEIDRTIILTADKDAMLASVLNPVPAVKGRRAGASIIPFLVQAHADQIDVEALVRPRMPVLMTAPELGAYAEIEEEEDAEDMAEEFFEAAPESADFLEQPVALTREAQRQGTVVAPAQKRTYVEDISVQPHGPILASEKESVQTKKARLDESVSTSLGQSSATEKPAAAVTQASTSGSQPAQSVPVFKPNSVASQISTTAPQPIVAAALPDEDDSHDELPTLNIDPDTEDEDDEDEDEDEDVTMGG